MKPYPELPQLAHFYFEDSYVLAIAATPGWLKIEMDLVLTPSHQEYRPAKPGEHYTYRHGSLIFDGVTTLSWTEQGERPAIDANQELDYGNIDQFEWEPGRFLFEGGFGKIDVRAANLIVSHLNE
jgi:hypothetical protein